MPMVDGDWTIGRSPNNIRYVGDGHAGVSPSYATAIEFHRWLGDFADDLVASAPHLLDSTDPTASERSIDTIISLVNGYNIDAVSAEHLYDGSIEQTNGDVVYYGFQNFGNTDVQINIIQNGSIIANDFWNFGGGGLNPNPTLGISHQFMLLGRTGAADIDGTRIISTARTYGRTFSEFKTNAMALGNNVLVVTDAPDINNTTPSATVATYTDILNSNEGYIGIDVDANGSDEFYYAKWIVNKPTRSINDFYERTKFLSQEGTAEILYGLSGDEFRGITHQIAISAGAGTWVEPESLSWGTGATAGTGQLLAVDNTTAASSTMMWIQLITGVVPNANTITGNGLATATAGTVTERTISTPFMGLSTGTAITGSYGLGVDVDDLLFTDTLFDLTNTAITPPNNVIFTVLDTVVGLTRLIVTNNDNGDIDMTQYTLLAALTAVNVTAVVLNQTIDSDTPTTGTIRIVRDDGLDTRHAYTSFSGSTFTIASTDFSTNNANINSGVFSSYIDLLATSTSESFGVPFDVNRTLFIRAKDGTTPEKVFESTAVLGSTGGSVTVRHIDNT